MLSLIQTVSIHLLPLSFSISIIIRIILLTTILSNCKFLSFPECVVIIIKNVKKSQLICTSIDYFTILDILVTENKVSFNSL